MTPPEQPEILNDYVAYYGKYEVDTTAGTVTHRRQNHLNPEIGGLSVVRYFSFACRSLCCSSACVALHCKVHCSVTSSINLGRTMNTDMLGGKTMAGNTENGGGRRGSRWRIAAWAAAALLLLLPLVAMQFTDEVVWDVADFAFAGALLVCHL